MPSKSEKIQVEGSEMQVYFSTPDGAGPFSAVVVGHAQKGVNEFIRSMCDRLARDGYAAAAPDLYHRLNPEQANSPDRVASLTDPRMVADVNATVDWLRNHSAVKKEGIGIVGFCMGGRVAWLAAATNPHIKATVPYYGGRIMVAKGAEKSPFELSQGIQCPMLFHFGEIDQTPSLDEMRKMDVELTRLGKTHQFYTYAGANHAFMDPSDDRYHREADERSWPRTLDFFASHLRGAAVAR